MYENICLSFLFLSIINYLDLMKYGNISEKNLRAYLTKRYNLRIANKLCCLFSWAACGSNKLDAKSFYKGRFLV